MMPQEEENKSDTHRYEDKGAFWELKVDIFQGFDSNEGSQRAAHPTEHQVLISWAEDSIKPSGNR